VRILRRGWRRTVAAAAAAAEDAGNPKKKPRNPKRWLEKRLKEAGVAASSQLASTFHRKGAAAGAEGVVGGGREGRASRAVAANIEAAAAAMARSEASSHRLPLVWVPRDSREAQPVCCCPP
jgi:hypothetical protein